MVQHQTKLRSFEVGLVLHRATPLAVDIYPSERLAVKISRHSHGLLKDFEVLYPKDIEYEIIVSKEVPDLDRAIRTAGKTAEGLRERGFGSDVEMIGRKLAPAEQIFRNCTKGVVGRSNLASTASPRIPQATTFEIRRSTWELLEVANKRFKDQVWQRGNLIYELDWLDISEPLRSINSLAWLFQLFKDADKVGQLSDLEILQHVNDIRAKLAKLRWERCSRNYSYVCDTPFDAVGLCEGQTTPASEIQLLRLRLGRFKDADFACYLIKGLSDHTRNLIEREISFRQRIQFPGFEVLDPLLARLSKRLEKGGAPAKKLAYSLVRDIRSLCRHMTRPSATRTDSLKIVEAINQKFRIDLPIEALIR